MNVFCGTGRLVADPTERKVGDYKVANFTIAIDREFSKDDKTDFLDCEAWGKTAEFLLNYLKKGNLVAVVGRVLKDSWEKAVERLCSGWKKNGIGWQTEVMPSKITGCKNVILYYGSSTYDSIQMSRLLDLIIQQCEQQGIPTLRDEADKLLQKWG